MMTLEEARARAKPGQYIMCLPSGSRYDEPQGYIVVSADERMMLPLNWITWERKD